MDLYNKYNVSNGESRKEKIRRKWLVATISLTGAAIIILTLLLFSSCEKKDLCILPHSHDSRICHTELTLKFNPAWDGEIIDSYTRAGGTTKMRYLVEFWAMNDEGTLTSLIERKEVKETASAGTTTVKVSADLPAFRIGVLCWAEPLIGTATTNACFNTADLRSVKLQAPYGKTEGRDAFTASATWDYTIHQYEREGVSLNETIHLLRPLGYYTLITNDIDEYKEKEGNDAPLPASVKVNYQLYIPSVFDVYRQIPSNPISGATYTYATSAIGTDEKQMLLAEDLIFIGTTDTDSNFFNATLKNYAADNALIKSTGNIGIQIQRNKHTLIYGAFLTTRQTNTPGVDDSFDDYEDIIIPD